MASLQNDKLTKWLVEKWQADKMASLQNDKLTKWQVGKMLIRHLGTLEYFPGASLSTSNKI